MVSGQLLTHCCLEVAESDCAIDQQKPDLKSMAHHSDSKYLAFRGNLPSPRINLREGKAGQ